MSRIEFMKACGIAALTVVGMFGSMLATYALFFDVLGL